MVPNVTFVSEFFGNFVAESVGQRPGTSGPMILYLGGAGGVILPIGELATDNAGGLLV